MTPDEALKVAEEALDHSHVDDCDCDCEDCAALAALARLREEMPVLRKWATTDAECQAYSKGPTAEVFSDRLWRESVEACRDLRAALARLEEGEGT